MLGLSCSSIASGRSQAWKHDNKLNKKEVSASEDLLSWPEVVVGEEVVGEGVAPVVADPS
jgi:hypothetical protein